MGAYKKPKCDWKNGKPIWYYQFDYQKKRYYSGGFSTRREALDAEAKERKDIKSKHNKPILKKDTLLSEVMTKYLSHLSLLKEQDIVKIHTRRSRPIISFFKNHILTNISVGDIHDYVEKRLKDGLANRSINLELTFIRNLFKYAIEYQYTNFNPAKSVKNLTEIHEERWIPEPDDLELFLSCARNTFSGKVLLPWSYFMVYTGARPNESYKARWEHINFDREEIKITNSKLNGNSKKYRIVEMHPELKLILLEWRKEWKKEFQKRHKRHSEEELYPHDWIFYNPRNQLLRAKSFTKCLYEARNKAKLPYLSPYTFRHYFISYSVMSGIDLLTIAKWVNHKNTKMIEEVYGHLSPKYRKKQMGKLKFENH